MHQAKVERQSGLDIAKGIGICLVVIYHCTEGILNSFPENTDNIQLLANFFRSWLMPMFFMVSGILIRRSILYSSAHKHRSKLFDWFYLYVVWSIIIYLTRLLSNSFTNTQMQAEEILHILWDPVPTIWFVYALLLSFAVTLLLRNQSAVLVITVAVAANLLNSAFFGWFAGSIFQQFFWIYLFYACGFYYADEIIALMKQKAFTPYYVLGFVLTGILIAVFKPSVPYYFGPLISLAMALAYLKICFWLSQYIEQSKWVSLSAYLGTISLFIYLTHFPFPAATRIVLTKLGMYSYGLNILFAVTFAVLVGSLAHKFSGVKPLTYLFKRPDIGTRNNSRPQHSSKAG